MGQPKITLKNGRLGRLESGWLQHLANSFKPYFIVFIASTCGLVIEIVAARILAPSIGVSLYTWTSIIGVVLAGISIGNYIGGLLADRFPSPSTLGFILLAGGVFTLSVLPLLNVVSEALQWLSLVPRIVFLTTTLFFLPSLILGMVTPVVIKLRLRDLSHTGNVVGKIYAVSTAGAIFGTFVTGFVLIQWIGTRSIILVVALILLTTALVFGNLWRAKIPALACLALFLILSGFTISNKALASDYLRESNYYSIRVYETIEEGRAVKALQLDALVHSHVSLEDPTFLAAGYEKVFSDIATYVGQRNPNPRVLFIGGGAYVMPRYFEEVYPQSSLEVIEIDPEVTRVAFDYLGLSPQTHIVTYNEDARMAVPKLPKGKYDLVIGDAFNDLSVPYHLTTMEFNEKIRALLKDDGIYAVNVVDKLHSGKFLRTYVNTLQQTFPYVYIICDSPECEDDNREPHVVVGSFQPLSSEALINANTQAGRRHPFGYITSEDALTSWLNAQANILLTDDYAPVDNLVAPLHLEKRFSLSKAEEHYNAGVKLESQWKLEEAITEYDKTIRLAPYFAEAYNNRGNSYAKLGQFQRAIQDFDEAIRLDSQYALARYSRGLAFANLGQIEKAIEDYDEAIHLNPNYVDAYNNRGSSYIKLGQIEKAIEDYDKVINLNPEFANAYFNRGIAYRQLGKKAEAMADFEKFITFTDNPEWIEMARQQIEEMKE
ncbi:fused MFS/spermidine synthase [Chloroflexota bacterium]